MTTERRYAGHSAVVTPIRQLDAMSLSSARGPEVRQQSRASNGLLDNIRKHRRQALADLADFARTTATSHDRRHDAPFEAARCLGRYLRNSVLTEHDLEAAIMNACVARRRLPRSTSGAKSEMVCGRRSLEAVGASRD
jgi:hypothetical protein